MAAVPPRFSIRRIGDLGAGTAAAADGDETQGHSVGVEVNLVDEDAVHSREQSSGVSPRRPPWVRVSNFALDSPRISLCKWKFNF